MNDEEVDELGPVDYMVVEFPSQDANFTGRMAEELRALTEGGLIRVLDLLFLKKHTDGSVEGFEAHEFEDTDVDALRRLETELAMLLAEEDVESIGAAMEPGSVAAVLVWENAWAVPFELRRPALRRSAGRQRAAFPFRPWRVVLVSNCVILQRSEFPRRCLRTYDVRSR